MIGKRNIYIAINVVIFLLTSCTSDDFNSISPSSATGPLVKQIVENFDAGNAGIVLRTIDHTYSGNKIIQSIDKFEAPINRTLTIEYVYTGNLLTAIQMTNDGGSTIETNITEISYDSSNRISQVSIDGDLHNYTYNSDGSVTRVSSDGNQTTVMTITNGNVTKMAYSDYSTGDIYIREDTFDSKNSTGPNIHQYETIMLVNGVGGINNDITSIVDNGSGPVLSYTRSYTYNSDNYPITMTTTQQAGTPEETVSTATVSYY